MSTLGVVVIGLAVASSLGILVSLSQALSISSNEQHPVGPWALPRRPLPPPPPIPRELNSLIWGETVGWMRTEQWDILVDRLEEMERQLGGVPSDSPAPAEYTMSWLDNRLDQLERLAGPMPAQMPPEIVSHPNSRWKKNQ